MRPRTYAEILKQSSDEKWQTPPQECPHCRNGAVIGEGTHYDVNRDEDVMDCSCSWCTEEWAEPIVDDLR